MLTVEERHVLAGHFRTGARIAALVAAVELTATAAAYAAGWALGTALTCANRAIQRHNNPRRT